MMKLLKYADHWGERIAWKIGDLTGEESYSRTEGQFSISLDFNVDSGGFKQYAHNPFRLVAEYLDHSFYVMFWRWGIWIAVRGRKVAE